MTADLLVPAREDTLPPAGRPLRHRVRVLAALLPFVVIGAARATYFAEGDTFWAVRTGAEILRQHTIVLPDSFSWTVPGRLWHPNSWLYDVLLHLADERGGRAGLGLAAMLSVTASGCGVLVAGRFLGARTRPLLVVCFLAMPVLTVWLSARPQTTTYALLPVTVALAGATVQWRGRRFLLGLAGLISVTALWVNLHLAALAAVFCAVAGLGLLLAVRRSSWPALVPRAALVVAATVLGCACSALGWSVVGSALATRDASTELITEWAPLWRTSTVCQATWLVAALALALTLASWRRRPDDELLPVWTGATTVLLLLGVSAARFSAMALVLALPAAARWVGETEWTSRQWRRTAAWLAPRLVVGLTVVLTGVTLFRLPHVGEPIEGTSTRALVNAVPAGCRVLNENDEGGWITYLRADEGVLVAQDGRNDVYGVAGLERVGRLLAGAPGSLAELAREDVRCLLLDPDRPIVAQARAAGWVQLAAEAHRVLLVAPPD